MGPAGAHGTGQAPAQAGEMHLSEAFLPEAVFDLKDCGGDPSKRSMPCHSLLVMRF